MAPRLEQERLKVRKARLIKQNEGYRQDLQDETENLRGAIEWMERGFIFYKAAKRIRKWTSPFSLFRSSKKRNPIATLLRGCAIGFRFWRNFRGA